MPKVVLNNRQFKITIPREIAIDKNWRAGTILRFVEDANGNICLKEVRKHG